MNIPRWKVLLNMCHPKVWLLGKNSSKAQLPTEVHGNTLIRCLGLEQCAGKLARNESVDVDGLLVSVV